MPPVHALRWCLDCWRGFSLPLRLACCPLCGGPMSDHCPVPRVRWNVTRKDWAMLKALAIDPERSHPELEVRKDL